MAVFGQGQQDHGKLFLADFPVAVKVAAAQNRFFKVQKILGVVILYEVKEKKTKCRQ